MPMGRAACATSCRDIWSLGSCSWCGIEFSGAEKSVERASIVHVCLRLGEQTSSSARFDFLEDLEALFELEIICDFHPRCGGIELQRILPELESFGIVAIQ